MALRSILLNRNALLRNSIQDILEFSQKLSLTTSKSRLTHTFRFPTYEICLFNHGQCEDDISRHFTGWEDPNLSPYGIVQAMHAGKVMCEEGEVFDIAYTSELSRAQDTVKYLLDSFIEPPKVFASWRLNDRHYGDLTGYNRSQMTLVYGERKLKEWLATYDTMPPIIKMDNPSHRRILENMARKHMNPDQIPRSESLQMVYNRVVAYWENIIVPSLKMRNKVIIVAHHESLCAIIRRFAELTEEETISLRLPSGIPFTFTLDNRLKIIQSKLAKSNKVKNIKSLTTTSPAEIATVPAKSRDVASVSFVEKRFMLCD